MASRADGACRACGRRALVEFLDLGEHPEANTFPSLETASLQPRWPLRAHVCRSCWLVQLDDAGPAEAALPGPPPYELSATMRQHAERFVDDVLGRELARPDGGRVLELASHGGYLQPFLAERGVRSLIVEGSAPLADAATRRGYAVVGRPFGLLAARELVDAGGPADLVVDNYLLAHVSDPDDFAAGLRVVLKPGGVAVLEFADLLPMLTGHAFDAIRHGHFSYLSLLSAANLLRRHGLVVYDVEAQPVYGGALRVFIAHAGEAGRPVAAAVVERLAMERRAGLSRLATYGRFGLGVGRIRTELRTFLEAARERGEIVVGYGAPSRGSTLLNYCHITTELLAYTVDRSPLKHGRSMPGSRLPIHDPHRIFETRPAFVLILTWDLADEVRRQLAAVADWGGRFVIPIPRVTVLP